MSIQDSYGATDFIADYTQEKIHQIVEWNGRFILNGVRNGLLGLSVAGTGVAIYEFVNPLINVTLPAWLLGTVAGSIAVVAVAGGVCLYTFSPPDFQALIVSLKEQTRRLHQENSELHKNVKKLAFEIDAFERAAQESQNIFVDFGNQLENSTHNFEISAGHFGKEVENLGMYADKLASLTANLKQHAGKGTAGQIQVTERPDHIAIDFADISNFLEEGDKALANFSKSKTDK